MDISSIFSLCVFQNKKRTKRTIRTLQKALKALCHKGFSDFSACAFFQSKKRTLAQSAQKIQRNHCGKFCGKQDSMACAGLMRTILAFIGSNMATIKTNTKFDNITMHQHSTPPPICKTKTAVYE